MLQKASAVKGYAIAASDGLLGTVSDFLFDDASWLVRWLVVDTGNWLPGRKVLLPTSVLGHADAKERIFRVKLTMQQVKDSPEISTDRPVSRQSETHIYNYYGWSPYWGTGFYMGGFGYMAGSPAMKTVAFTTSPKVRPSLVRIASILVSESSVCWVVSPQRPGLPAGALGSLGPAGVPLM